MIRNGGTPMAALAAALVLLLQAPQADDKKIQELVAKCASEDISEREAATRDLYAMGESAVPALEKAAASLKGEARVRLDRVIAELTMPARWAKEIVEGDWNASYQKLDNALRTKELEGANAARVMGA